MFNIEFSANDDINIIIRYDMYLERLTSRLKQTRGISFDEFKVFCQFLNNLEDFTIAMRMYTLADHPISKGK